jgi:hypothetical protein
MPYRAKHPHRASEQPKGGEQRCERDKRYRWPCNGSHPERNGNQPAQAKQPPGTQQSFTHDALSLSSIFDQRQWADIGVRGDILFQVKLFKIL